MTTYFERQLKEIEHSIHSIDMDVFEKMVNMAVETIKLGHKIIVSGLGKNVPICDKFVGSMISLGLDAYFLHTNSAVHGDMGIVKDGDMVIILTKSGETAESIYLTNLLKERTLTKEIPDHLVIDLMHEGDMWNIMPNNSTTMNLIVLQGLAMMIANRLGLELGDFKRNHPGGHIGEVLKNE